MLISIIGRFDGFGSPLPQMMRDDSRMDSQFPEKYNCRKTPEKKSFSVLAGTLPHKAPAT